MQVQVKVSPNVIITAEGEKQTDVFKELARLTEVFGQSKCGKCGGTNLRFVVRTLDNDFYEIQCADCKAKLTFGQHKKIPGSLFPHRKDKEDKYLPNNGWTVYVPPKTQE
jgi:hypothetical protein